MIIVCLPDRARRRIANLGDGKDIRSGLYPRPLPYTVGQDAVGTIVKLPSEPMQSTSLPALRLGQKVFTSASATFAEYVVAQWWRVAPIPEYVEDRDGVMLATIGLTAMTLVKESYEVKKGDWVLVRAAAGGVGLILCQVRRSISPLNHPDTSPLRWKLVASHLRFTTSCVGS